MRRLAALAAGVALLAGCTMPQAPEEPAPAPSTVETPSPTPTPPPRPFTVTTTEVPTTFDPAAATTAAWLAAFAA